MTLPRFTEIVSPWVRVCCFVLALCALPSWSLAQTTPDTAPPVVSSETTEPPTFPETEAMADFPVARLRALEKITARTVTFEAPVGATLKFGEIYIRIQA